MNFIIIVTTLLTQYWNETVGGVAGSEGEGEEGRGEEGRVLQDWSREEKPLIRLLSWSSWSSGGTEKHLRRSERLLYMSIHTIM